jgi:CubicO group peptidase (beta-lactamase class C family)
MRNKTITFGLIVFIGIVILVLFAIVLIPELSKPGQGSIQISSPTQVSIQTYPPSQEPLLTSLPARFSTPTFLPDQGLAQIYWPTEGWKTSTPEEQGFDSARLAEGLLNLKQNKAKIHSLLIIRNGRVILDAYFTPYDDSIPHKLASVTKSFTTTLIGIAIAQGKIQLDQPMVSFFPDRTIANLDGLKNSITIRNLVSMQNGYESGCLSGDEATLSLMRSNPDWVQAALDRKMIQEPGESFCYDSPGMHILSAILQQSTGMTEFEFAKKFLFESLGIRDSYWQSDPQGYNHGWGDLFLKPRDAAKLGYLWLNNGVWDGKQIVPATWVEDAVKAHSFGGMDSYGYGWWVSEDSYYAFGRGGQNIKIYPALNTIVVITANGVDYDQISPMLKGSFIDPNKQLPENQAGVEQLNMVVKSLAQSPRPFLTSPLPDTAAAISGKTYVFEPNPLDLVTLRLDFHQNEVFLFMDLRGYEYIWPIGLDGKYRLGSGGQAARGYWSDPQTFVFDVFEDGLDSYQLVFDGDHLVLKTPQDTLEGQVGSP